MFNIGDTLYKIAETTNKFLICVGMDGNYLYTNSAYNTRFGLCADQLIGQPSLKDIHQEDHMLVVSTVEKCLSEPGVAFDVIIRKPAKPSGYIYTQWDFMAITNEQGTPQYVMCIGVEITSFIEGSMAQYARLREIAFDQSHLVRRPLANILGLSKLLADKTMISNDRERNIMLEQLYAVAHELDNVVRSITLKAQER